MPTSTVPALKAALLSRLQADAAIGTNGTLGSIQITWGDPVAPGPDRNWVALGDVKDNQVAAALGAQKREETYTMDILISVLRPVRESQQSTTTFAYSIAAAIEASIRAWGIRGTADPFSTSTTGVRTVQVEGLDLTEPLDDQAREARIVMRIGVTARI